ncbi:MAG TPA: TetR/AcrR family transcriptional regulator [Terriglobales bacterium]|nr:TetR/AcrR family transcriptional regulator [Terriglobales bacterium]
MNVVQESDSRSKRTSKDYSRNAILNTAREIFLRDGYEAFSMRRLAADLGCAIGTPYVHFKSKQELFQTLVEQSFERLYQSLSGLRDRHQNGDAVILLKKGMYTYVQFGLQNSHDYRLAFLLSALSPQHHDRVHPVCELIGFMVARCVREERFREVDVETVAQALWAAIHGITALLIQQPGFPWVGRAKVIEQVINNAVDSLIAQPAKQALTARNAE